MKASLLLVPLFAVACGTTPDERPVTLEVVALSILAPTCGQVQCHSTSTHTESYAFDTLEAARASLSRLVQRGNANNSKLVDVLSASGDKRMPPDSPLADEDIALIEEWINAGAPGL